MQRLINVVFIFSLITNVILADVSRTVLEALQILYNATNGEEWTNNYGWNQGSPCDWHGCICSFDELIILDLTDNNLRGTLPSQIGLLYNLTNLILKDNYLSGSIPTEIALIDELSYLGLSNNTLSGTLPSQLGEDLYLLSIKDNDIAGTFPSDFISNHPMLIEAAIQNNEINGTITECVATSSIIIDCLKISCDCDNCVCGEPPTAQPTLAPQVMHSSMPTSSPSDLFTAIPTSLPTSNPLFSPTEMPSSSPLKSLSETPTSLPTYIPSNSMPSSRTSEIFSEMPTYIPSNLSSEMPSSSRSKSLTEPPTSLPTYIPSYTFTANPSRSPSSLSKLFKNSTEISLIYTTTLPESRLMSETEVEQLENNTLSFLNSERQAITYVNITITNQSLINSRRRKLQESEFNVELIVDFNVTGEYLAPPELDFDEIVVTRFENETSEYMDIIDRSEIEYFENTVIVQVHYLGSDETSDEGDDNTFGEFGKDGAMALTIILYTVIYSAGSYVLYQKKMDEYGIKY